MPEIIFETPQVFVPTPTQLDILRSVADHQSCHINQIVQNLYPGHSESCVRSGVRVLLSKRYLDGGKSTSETLLRLNSSGRILIQPAPAR